ncbi:5-formyltetrahydrofolate cyclo-ligase [Carboxylicivirga sp. M1479]|uniref:5-formyltetrahydrofolate cyclo-ligase n=1 Tax=Carboxylicivirga sp. M1479 TaxID=2594476 RepID=UPI001177E36D|nr:5-formyltetrahydrofolate cyclo-ligase [Carboxylicivirga sp. M1479]TRX70490.1 5-formyltetrahydrofolate cyclo-ligase [Carboxylicivirga sp. M1479]
MKDKQALRKQIRAIKLKVSEQDKQQQGAAVHALLEKSEVFKNAKAILMYWAMPDELPTQSFVNKWYTTKEIYLPVINGDDLKIVRYMGEESLVPGDKYGILEPAGEPIDNEQRIDMVVVPGVAFDTDNNRMGRGAGYYDRILKRIPSAKKIALAFDFQMVEHVPVEAHDIKMDMVLSV